MTEFTDQDKQRSESLSFQDITAEIGDIQLPVETLSPAGGNASQTPIEIEGGTVILDETTPVAKEEPSHTRVLTGSSPTPRPMWLEGLLSSVLGALFIIPIALKIALVDYQPWISYMVILLTVGASIWSLFGLQVETSDVGKKMCFISAALGVFVALIAFIVRAPV